MKIIPTPLEGCFELLPEVHQDTRGSFMETYAKTHLSDTLGELDFIQENEVASSYGVIRGMHYQTPPFAQAKLIRAISGKIIDIAIDLRPKSTTFLKFHRVELSGENKKQLFVPKGFAHGYSVISPMAVVLYKVDAPYAPEKEAGLSPLDPLFNFDWGIEQGKEKLNQRDRNWPYHEGK